jgi:hypothetical protein
MNRVKRFAVQKFIRSRNTLVLFPNKKSEERSMGRKISLEESLQMVASSKDGQTAQSKQNKLDSHEAQFGSG